MVNLKIKNQIKSINNIILYEQKTHNNSYNSEHSDNFLNPAFQKTDETKLSESQDEKLSRKSIKKNYQKDMDYIEEEDFTAEMNENVEATKLKSRQVKQKKENLPSFSNLDSPTLRKYRPPLKDERHMSLNSIENTKKNSLIILKQGSLKKIPAPIKQRDSIDRKYLDYLKIDTSERTTNENDEIIDQKEDGINEDQVLIWDYTQTNELDEGPEPPELIVKLTTKDIAITSLQICFWGLTSTDPLEKTDETGKIIKYMDNHIAGECYISLNRIFSIDPTMMPYKGQNVQLRKKVVQEKLWNHGKEVGHTTSNFKMIVGVQSENGVLKASPAIYNFKETTQASNQDIQALNTAKNILNDCVFTLYEKKQILDQKDREKIKSDINNSFQTVYELAQKSHKESIKSFYYKSQEDLLQSQDILIDIAKHLTQYADEVDEYLRDNYYECLKIIINRGEFDLNYMGFDDSYQFLLQSAQGAQFKKTDFNKDAIRKIGLKMKVALSYQKLLYNILEKVLDKLNQKALSDKERQFVENYCAIAYFRIPEFREKLLSIVVRPDDIEIIEWRGTEYQLDEKKNSKLLRNNEFISLFDWDNGFYRFLKTQERGEQHFQDLTNILNDTKWSSRMSKRGVAFFFFLTEWLQYVNKTVVVKDHVPWQDLPGYLTLLRAFLIELKQRDIHEYPEAMKIASSNILNNERLLNILITLLYNKTNVHDSSKVVNTYDLINSWMQFLQHNNKNIPTVFDFSFFFKGIRIVLEQDHSICLARIIWVIYNNFTLFPPDFQREICEYLFSNMFFKINIYSCYLFRLFMHWSFNVRMIFQYFIMYRIHHLFQEQKTKYKTIERRIQKNNKSFIQFQKIIQGFISTSLNIQTYQLTLIVYQNSDLKRQILNNTNFHERKFALINDLIFLLYTRMMNIIELARVKYASQEQRREEELLFHQKMRQKLIEKQENKYFLHRSSRQNSQSILEISFTQERERVQEEMRTTNNILDDLENGEEEQNNQELNEKDKEKSPQEKDMLYDSFENAEIQQIQKAQSTISEIKVHLKRTNSVSQTPQILQKEDTQFEYGDQNMEQSKRSNSLRKSSLNRSTSFNNIGGKQQVVIYNRKVGYQIEKTDEDLLQIERTYIKYIAQSCAEFEAIRKGYEKWYKQKVAQLPLMSKEKRWAHIRKFIIPEVQLRATIDEAEASYSQLDEW